MDKEKAMLAAGLSAQCNAYVERGELLLTLVSRCPAEQISYELPSGLNPNPLAPADKSCHVFDANGAGVLPCGPYLGAADCDLPALAVGEKCANADIAYVGVVGGARVYTSLANQGTSKFNNGAVNCPGQWVGGASSATDGPANTNTLMAASNGCEPYLAAVACRALGADWYLPASQELVLLNSVRTVGVFNGTTPSDSYWTSTVMAPTNGVAVYFHATPGFIDPDGDWTDGMSYTEGNNTTFSIRCFRR